MTKVGKLTLACAVALAVAAPLYSRFRGGQFFGGMAAGGLIGGLVGNKVGKDNARREQPVVVQQVPPQVQYVPVSNGASQAEVARLQQENAALNARLKRLEQAQSTSGPRRHY